MLACANCADTISEDYAEVAGWRYWSDGLGELHLFCEICSAREFAAHAPRRPMPDAGPMWTLSCGHTIPLLEHERPADPPRRRSNQPLPLSVKSSLPKKNTSGK